MATYCSDKKIKFGNWEMTSVHHEYFYLTDNEARTLGEELPPPPPPPAAHKRDVFDDLMGDPPNWTRVKDINEIPSSIKNKYKPYAIEVKESGFAYLQTTPMTHADKSYEDLQWSWKIVLENKRKHGIYAYGGYALFDKDNYVLTSTGVDWDYNEPGTYIKAGMRGIINGRGNWKYSSKTNPYPPTRVYKGDYKLFIRDASIQDEWDKIKNK